jgi:hypothetical protein
VAPNILWTAGHSNRQQSEFIDLLLGERIEAVANVRRFPGSRRCPYFGRDVLETALHAEGIEYRHFGDLGGRRIGPRRLHLALRSLTLALRPARCVSTAFLGENCAQFVSPPYESLSTPALLKFDAATSAVDG